MKGWLKILLGAAGALVVVIAVALVGLLWFFDPDDYKSRIDTAIGRQIGRPITIHGDIRLALLPWPSIRLGRVSVANAPGFGRAPMATMRSAELGVRLWPLFARQIRIGTVSLNDLRLRLARNAQGKTNWGTIVGRLSAAQRDDIAPASPPGGGQGFDPRALRIGAVELQNAAISWTDAVTGADYRLRHTYAETGRLRDGRPFRLQIAANFAAPEDDVQANLSLVTRIEPHLADRFYRFSNLSVNVLASGGAVPGKRQEADLSASGDVDLSAGRFKLADLTLQAADLNISGSVDGTGLNGRLAYNGRITVAAFDPRSVMQQLALRAPATQDSGALSAAGFDAQFDGGAKQIQFKQVAATLDDSTLEGTAAILHFAHPTFAFNLSLDRFDVDDYLPPGSAEQAQTGQPAQGGGAGGKNAGIDLAPLKRLRLDGRLSVGSLTAANVHVGNAKLALKARNGVLHVAPLTADLYGGKLRLNARVNAEREPPRYALTGRLTGLRFAPLLADVAGTDRVAANADINVDLTAAGGQVATMMRTLGGHVGFDLENGAFNGFDLARMIAAAGARVSGQTPADSGVGSDDRTPFSRLTGRFNIDNGAVIGKHSRLAAKGIDATGSGRYDLVDNALDYTVKARVPESAAGSLAKLAGATVPIHLTGSLWAPRYRLDVAPARRGPANKPPEQE